MRSKETVQRFDLPPATRRNRAPAALTTKLHRPPVTPDLEQRTRLVERLERKRHRPLTLISAPAGYGKAILASMWLEFQRLPQCLAFAGRSRQRSRHFVALSAGSGTQCLSNLGVQDPVPV